MFPPHVAKEAARFRVYCGDAGDVSRIYLNRAGAKPGAAPFEFMGAAETTAYLINKLLSTVEPGSAGSDARSGG